MIFFKQKFFEAIRRGEKTQTLRVWRGRRASAGQVRTVPGLGRIEITAVDAVALSSLTRADAQLDGFPSLAALRRELKSIYGERLTAGETLYRVRFTYVEDSPPPRRSRRKPSSKQLPLFE